MRHISLTCKNHPQLRWSTKEIAWKNERYIGTRILTFHGEVKLDAAGQPKLFADLSGTDCHPASECECSAADLVRAPEDKRIEAAWEPRYDDRTPGGL